MPGSKGVIKGLLNWEKQRKDKEIDGMGTKERITALTEELDVRAKVLGTLMVEFGILTKKQAVLTEELDFERSICKQLSLWYSGGKSEF